MDQINDVVNNNKNSGLRNIMSIRVSADGLCFDNGRKINFEDCRDSDHIRKFLIEQTSDKDNIKVEFESHKSVIVPKEIYDPGLIKSYFRLSSLDINEVQEKIIPVAIGDLMVIFSVGKNIYETFFVSLGNKAEFGCVLSEVCLKAMNTSGNMILDFSGDDICLATAENGKIIYADCLALKDCSFITGHLKLVFTSLGKTYPILLQGDVNDERLNYVRDYL